MGIFGKSSPTDRDTLAIIKSVKAGKSGRANVLDLSARGIDYWPPEISGLGKSLKVLILHTNAIPEIARDVTKLAGLTEVDVSRTLHLPEAGGRCVRVWLVPRFVRKFGQIRSRQHGGLRLLPFSVYFPSIPGCGWQTTR